MNQLKIIQHNCHSLTKIKKNLLENYIQQEKIYVILLSETWFKKDKQPKIANLNGIFKNREDGYGGVAIYINNHIQYEELNINNLNFIEVIAIKTIQQKKDLALISVYIPPNGNSKEVRKELATLTDEINKIKEDIILGGDFNAHNQIWGDNKTCRRGKDLEYMMELTNLINVNNEESTLVSKNDCNSVIDLTFISNNII